ncbi:MAG: DUF4190 domain-containing protein [Rhodoluna sp.]|nr:DUF4190 domain-containing protein [Rhodoluna sp.]
MRTKIASNVPALIAAILAGLAGFTNLFAIKQITNLEILSGGVPDVFLAALLWKAGPFLGLVLGTATLVLAFVRFSKTLNAVLIGLGFAFVAVISNISLLVLVNSQYGPGGGNFFDIFWYTGSPEEDAISIGNVLWVLAAISAGISLLIRPAGGGAISQPVVQSNASANRFDPMTGQPIAPVAPAGQATSNLPLIALILAFFVPLAAVIVGHISLNQMKQGLISSANLGMAKAGLILGYVFIGLSFIFGIIFAVVYVTVLSRQYY